MDSFIFKYNGKEINPKLTFEEIANENDKNNNRIHITVDRKDKAQENEKSFPKNTSSLNIANSKNIINKENKNYKPNEISKLNNNTNISNNNINIPKIKLLLFKSNSKELKAFLKKIVGDYKCYEISDGRKHNEKFISYCETCQKNICFLCKIYRQHSTHKILGYENNYIDKKELEVKMQIIEK